MRAAPWLALASLVALVACEPDVQPSPGPADADRDGVLDAGDCAPQDPSRWQRASLFTDADRDGLGAGQPAMVCAGDGIPAGYASSDGDCDDSDPAAYWRYIGYADDDADGFGAGPRLEYCAGDAPPRVLSVVAGDCAPDDPRAWQELPYLYRDADGDGFTVPREGVVCSGFVLPAGYTTEPTGIDCDDGDPAAFVNVSGYADLDLDGLGAGAPATFCTAGALPGGYVAETGDCAPEDATARWTTAYAFRDADLDGRTVPQAGTLCTGGQLPAGYLTTASGNDCDDANREVWELRYGVADSDRDGYGAGEQVSLCTDAALPAGWVAPGGETDCAPDDSTAWRSWSYSYRDADGDTYTVWEPGTLCIGTAAPPRYATSPTGNDCDEANPLVWATMVGYADADLDGVGAQPSITSCTDGTLPAGQVATGTDCAPDDAARWQLLAYTLADRDGDGFTAPVAPGQVCAGAALPDPYRAAAVGRDCDDADPSVHRAIVRYPDGDGDGVGATPRAIFCVAETEPAGYSRFGWDVDDADPAVQWDGSDAEILLGLL